MTENKGARLSGIVFIIGINDGNDEYINLF